MPWNRLVLRALSKNECSIKAYRASYTMEARNAATREIIRVEGLAW